VPDRKLDGLITMPSAAHLVTAIDWVQEENKLKTDVNVEKKDT
jgi:hypothetical protein